MSFSDIKGFNTILKNSADVLADTILDSESPKEQADKVKRVVKEVLNTSIDSPAEILKAKEFLSKIEAINQKIEDRVHQSPFKLAVKLLHEKFDEVISSKLTPLASPSPESTHKTPSSKLTLPPPLPTKPPGPSTSSIQKIRQAFEQRPTESIKSPPTTSTVKKKVIIGVPVTFASIKASIGKLDLSDPTLPEKINQIKADLAKLKATGGISAEQMKSLTDALESLHDSFKKDLPSFAPSVYETQFFIACAAKNPLLKKAIDDSPNAAKLAKQDARKEILTTIQKSLETPASLIATISKKNDDLAAEMPKMRFKRLMIGTKTLTDSPPFNKNFVNNLPEVLQAFESFSKGAYKVCLKKPWESHLASMRDKVGSDFIEALQKHPSCNFAAHYEEFLDQMQKEYLELFDLKKVNESTTIKTYLDTVKGPARKQAERFFNEAYNANFLHMISWLTQNYTHVEKAYDQTDESDTNLGGGVCFANCLERTQKLLTRSALPSKDIEMGSTEVSRMAQNLYKRQDTPTLEELNKLESETAKRLGLKLTKKVTVPYDETDPTKSLGTTLAQVYRETGEKATPTLILRAPGKGHAINIQMDKAAGQFRFFDDNFGICGKYDKFENFQKAFVEYIQAAYSDYIQFSLLSYSLAS